MRTPNIWNQFHLCRHKIGVILCLLVASFSVKTFAQRSKSINLPFYDERKIHFGFQLGGMHRQHRLATLEEHLQMRTFALDECGALLGQPALEFVRVHV